MKLLRPARQEQGVALMMVLVISAIVLIIMSSMIYMLTEGTRISGVSKRYASATEAAEAGVSITRAIVDRKDNLNNLVSDYNDISLAFGNEPCARTKLHNSTSAWGGCDGSYIIDVSNGDTYDYVFQLGDYDVYAKITYTVEGNSAGAGGSGGTGGWSQRGVVYSSGRGNKKGSSTGKGGEVTVAHYEYLYNVEIDARNRRQQDERARLSMLYQY